jgi:hypothetical protein
MLLRAALAAFASLSALPASALVVGGAVTGGTSGGTFVLLAAAPAVVGDDSFGSPDVFAFDEQQGAVLPFDLLPNIGPLLLAGARFNSHVVAFDPAGAEARTAEGHVLFDRDIVALFTGRRLLETTAPLFGAPGTSYQHPAQVGLELDIDRVQVDPTNRRRLDYFFSTSSPGDMVRVFTFAAPIVESPVPEPSTWALLIAGFGLVGATARRRVRAVQA